MVLNRNFNNHSLDDCHHCLTSGSQSSLKQGTIYQILAGYYDLKSAKEFIRLRAAGTLRYEEKNIIVGDEVLFDQFVRKVLPRKNFLLRPKVANVDYFFIIMSSVEPTFSSFLLDKFLALAYLSEVEPLVVFTKIDLNKNLDMDFYLSLHQTFFVRIDQEDSYQALKPFFETKRVVLGGQSGVGKTTIYNHLVGTDYATQAISKALGRGKHTTRVVRMQDFLGGQIIDSPGFSVLDLGTSQQELAWSFIFFKDYLYQCKFRNCLHFLEDSKICYVKKSLNKGLFPKFRYNNYLKLLKELK